MRLFELATLAGIALLALGASAGKRRELPAGFEKLHPEPRPHFVELFELARRASPKAFLASGYRSQAEQDALYAQGRTTPGRVVTNAKVSYHTSGRAIDLGGLGDAELRALGAWWQRKGIRFRWGGTFTNLYDPGHFEMLP